MTQLTTAKKILFFGHVEILRCFQQKVIIGRSLEVENVAQAVEGETNYINVDRNNLIETAFEEIIATLSM